MGIGSAPHSALNRRRHQRAACEIPANFRFPATGLEGRAIIVNFALGGVRIDFPVEVNVPSEVELTMDLPEGMTGVKNARLMVGGKVVWSVTDRPDGPFPAGVQFLPFNDGVRRKVLDLLGFLLR